jgi:hypothetical protein
LNLLSTPRSPRVRLRRYIRFLLNTVQSKEKLPVHDELFGTSGGGLPVVTLKLPTKRATSVLELTAQRRGNKPVRNPAALTGNPNPSAPIPAGNPRPGSSESSGSESDYDDEREIINGATWWINTGDSQYTQEPGVENLQGEIHLPKDLQPTCRFPLFSIKVS